MTGTKSYDLLLQPDVTQQLRTHFSLYY